MSRLLYLVLSLSFSGSLVFLVLLIIKRLLGHRVTQTWLHYIWVITALRFLTPFTPEIISMPLCSNAEFVKERLDMMLNTRKKLRLVSVLTFSLTAILCCGAFYTGAHAAPAEEVLEPAPEKQADKTIEKFSNDTSVIEGYQVLKDETVSLNEVKSISLDYGLETELGQRVRPSNSLPQMCHFIVRAHGRPSFCCSAVPFVSQKKSFYNLNLVESGSLC